MGIFINIKNTQTKVSISLVVNLEYDINGSLSAHPVGWCLYLKRASNQRLG